MRTLIQTFTGVWSLGVGGKYMRVIAATADIDVTFFRRGAPISQASAVGVGYYAVPDGGFDRVDVTSAGSQTVKVAISDGGGGYDAVAVVGSVSAAIVTATAIDDAAPVTVGTAATGLLALDAARKGARFYNAGGADVYLGGAGVTVANGVIKLVPGGTWIETDAPGAAWYGISGTAGQSVRIQGLS